MESVSTSAGAITYILYAIPIFAAIWIGLIQLQVQVKVQKDIYKAEKFDKARPKLIQHMDTLLASTALLQVSGDVDLKSKRDQIQSIVTGLRDFALDFYDVTSFLGTDITNFVLSEMTDLEELISLLIYNAEENGEPRELCLKTMDKLNNIRTELAAYVI